MKRQQILVNEDSLEELSHTWFSSDHHFGHRFMLAANNRPFDTVEQMDEEMVRRWNMLVDPLDTVYYLGDFTLRNKANASAYFRQLSGKITYLIVPWHHDSRWYGLGHDVFHSADDIIQFAPCELIYEPIGTYFPNGNHRFSVHLSHYPLLSWEKKFYGGIHLHGHVHANSIDEGYVEMPNSLNVNVEFHEYAPINMIDVMHKLGIDIVVN